MNAFVDTDARVYEETWTCPPCNGLCVEQDFECPQLSRRLGRVRKPSWVMELYMRMGNTLSTWLRRPG